MSDADGAPTSASKLTSRDDVSGHNAASSQAGQTSSVVGRGAGLDDLFDNGSAWSPYLSQLVAISVLGGLQFGVDTGIVSGMLVAIREDLGHPLTAGEQELIVSATTVGAIFGALAAGQISDWLGRKKVMMGACVMFALGSFEQAASQVVRELILGRFMVGVGVGMSSMVVPTYLGEIAPSRIRGRVLGLNSLLVTGGQLLAYATDAICFNIPHGWRWMALSAAIPAVVQLIALFALHESPRWLLSRRKIVEARLVLQRIYPHASVAQVDTQVDAILAALSQPSTRPDESRANSGRVLRAPAIFKGGSSLRTQLNSLFREAQHRRALILACGLQFFQQTCGFNSLMYFSSRLLLMAGFTSNPNAAALSIAFANFVGTAIATRYVDVWGRRRLLLYTTAAMCVSLVLLGAAFHIIEKKEGLGSVVHDKLAEEARSPSAWAYISVVAMAFFSINYALGLGIIPWLVQSEVFSGQVRAVGGALATATNWSGNLLISAFYLDLVRLITASGSFWMYSVVALLSWLFTHRYMPELTGVAIEDAHRAFDGRPPAGGSVAGTSRAGYRPLRIDDADEEAVWDADADDEDAERI